MATTYCGAIGSSRRPSPSRRPRHALQPRRHIPHVVVIVVERKIEHFAERHFSHERMGKAIAVQIGLAPTLNGVPKLLGQLLTPRHQLDSRAGTVTKPPRRFGRVGAGTAPPLGSRPILRN